jgi:leader peptidase (prepilin peptidase)/N-methyltransferase
MIRPMLVTVVPESTPGVWAVVAASAALLAVFLFVACLVYRKFSKRTDLCSLWPLYLSAVIGLILLLRFGTSITTVKGMLLTLILLYASLSDLKYRKVPNCISLMLLILSFVGFDIGNLGSMLLGAAVVFIPVVAATVLTPTRPIGGADIKISTALAFLLGLERGLLALIVGLLLAVVVHLLSDRVTGRDPKQPFPLVPYLWIGATLAYMI